jgi:hypothetical protein
MGGQPFLYGASFNEFSIHFIGIKEVGFGSFLKRNGGMLRESKNW